MIFYFQTDLKHFGGRLIHGIQITRGPNGDDLGEDYRVSDANGLCSGKIERVLVMQGIAARRIPAIIIE